MSVQLLLIVSALYAGTAIDLLLKKQPAMAAVFACYAVANSCFVLTIK